jgi:hypothetical protein
VQQRLPAEVEPHGRFLLVPEKEIVVSRDELRATRLESRLLRESFAHLPAVSIPGDAWVARTRPRGRCTAMTVESSTIYWLRGPPEELLRVGWGSLRR